MHETDEQILNFYRAAIPITLFDQMFDRVLTEVEQTKQRNLLRNVLAFMRSKQAIEKGCNWILCSQIGSSDFTLTKEEELIIIDKLKHCPDLNDKDVDAWL